MSKLAQSPLNKVKYSVEKTEWTFASVQDRIFVIMTIFKISPYKYGKIPATTAAGILQYIRDVNFFIVC